MNPLLSILFLRKTNVKILIHFLLSFTVCTIVPCTVVSQTLDLMPVMDNTIYSEGDLSNGTGIYLFAGRTKKSSERRVVLKFDLTSVSTTDSVSSAALKLYLSRTITDTHLFTVYRLTKDWGEGESDAIYEEGGGASATTGDATWNYSFFNTSVWSRPGGDFNADPSASFSLDTTGLYSWSDDGLLSDIRFWIDHPESNFGWIIIADDTLESAKRFNSRENPENPPLLSLTTSSANLSVKTSGHIDLRIYPNPSNGDFFIRAREPFSIASLKVFDLNGREIAGNLLFKEQISTTEFHLHIRFKGVFFVEIDHSKHLKVIVQ